MDDKRISIIIPAYNEERHLVGCLEAIAKQTAKPYEVIVVDNNSTDKTADIARQFPFVTVVAEPRQGIVFARNRGFNAATGDILARIDADTILPSDWVAQIQTFYAEAAHAKSAVTGGCYFYNLRSGRAVGRMYDLVVHRLNRLLLGYYFPWGANGALPREAWLAARDSVCMRNDMHEDLDLGIHLHTAGYSVAYGQIPRVGAVARRILSDRTKLWPYLAMWPRTFRVDYKQTWPLVYPLAWFVWLGSYQILLTEKLLGLREH